jgi:hypothetical protein
LKVKGTPGVTCLLFLNTPDIARDEAGVQAADPRE